MSRPEQTSHPEHGVSDEVWTDFVTRHATGGALQGVVVVVRPFGAFVDVGQGIHGLLHVSSWTERTEPGATVTVRIGALDVERRRMSLIPVQ